MGICDAIRDAVAGVMTDPRFTNLDVFDVPQRGGITVFMWDTASGGPVTWEGIPYCVDPAAVAARVADDLAGIVAG